MSCHGPTREHFPHAADMGVRGYGATPGEAFESAALAMTEIVTDPAEVRPAVRVELRVEAANPELLFYDFLNALIYRMSVDGLVFGRFAVRLDGPRLEAEAWGEPVDRARHQPAVEIKGATFTALSVRQQPDGRWVAQCVLDV
jgi:SHS2 domain-containing protein